MPKTVNVEGQLLVVPDDATPDEIDQIFQMQGQHGGPGQDPSVGTDNNGLPTYTFRKNVYAPANENISDAERLSRLQSLPNATPTLIKQAMKLGINPPAPSQQEKALAEAPGFWHSFGTSLKNAAVGIPAMARMAGQALTFDAPSNITPGGRIGSPEAFQQAAQTVVNDAARKAEGRSAPYRAVAAVGENALPMDVRGMEQQANIGNTEGVAGQATAATALALGLEARRGQFGLADKAIDPLASRLQARKAAAVYKTVPEAAALPPEAVNAAEGLFRAAAPVGSDPMFRGNLYKAVPDLAEIGRDVDLSQVRGGVARADMRPKATVNAINDHLRQMYETERAPQIARHADAPVVANLGTDAVEGLKFVARTAGESGSRALAQKVIDGGTLSLGEWDQLGRIVNQELSPLRGMTPQELAQSGVTNRRLTSLKALDGDIGNSISTELTNRGEGGIGPYEQRYAALSSIRDQIQKRANLTELQRNIPGLRWMNALRGKNLAGASQSAVANVNIGRSLEKSLSKLGQTGLTAERPTGTGPVPVRGLLPEAQIRLGSRMEPIGDLSSPPPALVREMIRKSMESAQQ